MTGAKGGPPLKFPALSGDPDRDRIIALRQRLGISQADLAKILKVGVTTVQGWESGYRKPSKSTLLLIDVLWPD